MAPLPILVRSLLSRSLAVLGLAIACATPRPVPSPLEPDAGFTPIDAGSPEPVARVDAGATEALPPSPNDPLTALYSKRLDFRGGAPVVPVRLMEGGADVTFSPRGRMRVRVSGPIEKLVEAPAHSVWRVRVTQSEPARILQRVVLEELQFADRAGLEALTEQWRARGVATRPQVLGAVYGIAGKVIDTRRTLLTLAAALGAEDAPNKQAWLLRTFGARTSLVDVLEKKPTGILELLDEGGASIALGENRIVAEVIDGSGFDVRKVEFGVGYDFHDFEDRSYRGALELTIDRNGRLAVVNLVTLEDLLKGLVPSEIFARAPQEALRAQAVTARGEVLAKIGTKHLGDPYLLCSEQHCAVYKGFGGETPQTNAAVDDTRGQAVFSSDGRLVDSVYSAVCGGHTEDNDAVWGGIPNPNLRGRPDFIGEARGLPSPRTLLAFLTAELPSACRLTTFAQPSKYRWERHFTAGQMNALAQPLGVGAVQNISVVERGVSGRAKLLTIAGEMGATQLRGELNIRRAFGMLNSAMFVVTPERDGSGRITGWLFRGGGWGHGVGLCQTGAIGRAEAGQHYQTILRHYFNGAQVSAIY